MHYYHTLGGLVVTILTILFGAMSLAPLITRPEGEPTAPDGRLWQSEESRS